MIAKVILFSALVAVAYSLFNADCKVASEFSYDDGSELDATRVNLVFFSGSYCSYSDRMLPPFCDACTALLKLYSTIKVWHVFCDQDSNKQTCRDSGVTSYPQVGIVKNGKTTIMPNKRGPKDAVIAFVKATI